MIFNWIKKQEAQNLIDLALLPITSRLTKLEQQNYYNKILELEQKVKKLEDFKLLIEKENNILIDYSKITWDSSKFTKKIVGDKTLLTLYVNNSFGKKVYYKSNYQDWTEGDLTMPQTGICEPVWFKIEGNEEIHWGCVTIEKQENLINFISSCS